MGFLKRAFVFIIAALLEDAVQINCQYFYYEKFFVSFDLFIVINALMLIISGVTFVFGTLFTFIGYKL